MFDCHSFESIVPPHFQPPTGRVRFTMRSRCSSGTRPGCPTTITRSPGLRVSRVTPWRPSTPPPPHCTQKTYFNANCMILGSDAVRIWPKVLLDTVLKLLAPTAMLTGAGPGRKLFVTLNASARISNRLDSETRKDRERAISKDHSGRYVRLLR